VTPVVKSGDVAGRVVAVNLTGVVETPTMPDFPYLIDADGKPYVPIGTAGVVLGVRLGDGVFAHDADHAAPGVTLAHPDQAARHGLTAFACFGNAALVRTGAAAGEAGIVLGKRGEEGRVIVVFPDDVLARLVPGDSIVVRGFGQGAELPDTPDVRLLNAAPDALAYLPVTVADGTVTSQVRAAVPSALVGNGIGRPAQMWDVDLQVTAANAGHYGLAGLRLGDLVAVDDLDVRHNIGYRRGLRTIGLVVHGASPQPGHGPGLMPILCGPAARLQITISDPDRAMLRLDDLHFRP
jgi:hypothetical protein